ncbi:hypothetical protein GDO78_004465 [Eleutherodactylus coqui]|uniref:IF rod domain-containing protein n=1 Tax=Eleutherodactylus coqui TaxID=57060 RepID=A0A8J6EQY6_ELECQ|nr:hypothetical protein GDO78_004465 [Eleutherodactylus coqui]
MKLKHLVFTLETELKKQRDMKTVHECTLAEIREHYSSNLRDLQDVISVKESHLANIQYKLKHLNYENLNLDLKASLEKEIDAYTHMLGEHHNLPLTHHTEK